MSDAQNWKHAVRRCTALLFSINSMSQVEIKQIKCTFCYVSFITWFQIVPFPKVPSSKLYLRIFNSQSISLYHHNPSPIQCFLLMVQGITHVYELLSAVGNDILHSKEAILRPSLFTCMTCTVHVYDTVYVRFQVSYLS